LLDLLQLLGLDLALSWRAGRGRCNSDP